MRTTPILRSFLYRIEYPIFFVLFELSVRIVNKVELIYKVQALLATILVEYILGY
jgi:hypothetical protein